MIISSDLHIKKYTSCATIDEQGRNTRMMHGIGVLHKLVQMAKEDDGRLILAGDIFDERDFVDTEAYYLVYQCLKEARASGVHTTVILGNHELLEHSSTISVLHPLESVSDVVSEICSVAIDGVSVTFLPWQRDWSDVSSRLEKELIFGDNAAKRLLIGHAPVAGAVLGASNYRLREGGVTPEDLRSKDFRHVILGHYHKAQHVTENTCYVGSPLQLNFGEAGDEKRVLRLDTKTMKMESIPLVGLPKFYLGAFEDGAVHIVSEDKNFSGFLKVYCAADDNLVEIQAAVDRVRQDHDILSVQIERLPSTKKYESRIEITAETKDTDIVKRYVEYVPTVLDKVLLHSIGEQLINAKSVDDICKGIVDCV